MPLGEPIQSLQAAGSQWKNDGQRHATQSNVDISATSTKENMTTAALDLEATRYSYVSVCDSCSLITANADKDRLCWLEELVVSLET
jgi:hypothetical protein